jgi:hypothetical protein
MTRSLCRPALNYQNDIFWGVQHAHIHDWRCRVRYGLKRNRMVAWTDGEQIERLFSHLSLNRWRLMGATKGHYRDTLAEQLAYLNERTCMTMAKTLVQRLLKNRKQIPVAEQEYKDVSLGCNHTPSHMRNSGIARLRDTSTAQQS